MKIDLQIHTTHSDGRDTPKEIIALAKEGDLNIISITDHDTISGIKESVVRGRKNGIRVIPAIEITTGYKNFPLHILGYNIEIKDKGLSFFLKKINEFRKKHFIKEMSKVNKNLISDGKESVNIKRYQSRDSKYYSIPGIALFLYEEGSVNGRNDGFYYLKGVSDAAPPIQPKDAFRVIHKSGGKAILSHPLAPLISLKEITLDKKEQEKIIVKLKKQGLDGLECYQTGHNKEDINFILQLSKKYSLLISAGSDWHGSINQTGKTIKKYLPYYLNKLGDLFVPKEKSEEILRGLLEK